jgi:hypothetical protein
MPEDELITESPPYVHIRRSLFPFLTHRQVDGCCCQADGSPDQRGHSPEDGVATVHSAKKTSKKIGSRTLRQRCAVLRDGRSESEG